MNLKFKKSVIYGVCAGACIMLFGGLYYINLSSNKNLNNSSNDYQYVSRLFGSDDEAVVSTQDVLIRPYTDDKVKIIQNFYDYKGSEEEQENSIINYEQTYIQNNGVAYGGIDDGFDVVSSLSGTVVNVTEDDLLGNVVEIQNSDKVTIIYQSLSEVTVKKDDNVNQGDIIGKSGESNMNKDFGVHVIFELKIDDVYVNPEEYYDKNINEL